MTPFEKHLSEIPPRTVPEDWREAILGTARKKKSGSFLAAIQNPKSKIKSFLWPHPWAWATLTACWLLIAGLNFSGPRGPELYAVTPKGTVPLKITPEAYAVYVEMRNQWLAQNVPTETSLVPFDRRKL